MQRKKTSKYPPSLFAHNMMQRAARNLDCQNGAAKGILGRMISALTSQVEPFVSQLVSLNSKSKMTEGGPSSPIIVSGSSGIPRMAQYKSIRGMPSMAAGIKNLTDTVSSSIFADTYKRSTADTVASTESLGEKLSQTPANCAKTSPSNCFGNAAARSQSRLQLQFEKVARMIKMRNGSASPSERATFYTSQGGGYDTHANLGDTLDAYLTELDNAVGDFAREMKSQGLWDNVVMVTTSDFARTLTSNGLGTDHGWGGNNFVMGGKIKGGQILGDFPTTLAQAAPLSISHQVGRGRLVPTTPWESIWHAISQWMDVDATKMKELLPNMQNFPADKAWKKEAMFE